MLNTIMKIITIVSLAWFMVSLPLFIYFNYKIIKEVIDSFKTLLGR